MAANKHQQRTEATRRRLLRAGQRVFARDGFSAARIEDIAAEAGHTRGAFYAQFDSKEDLFFALLEDHSSRRLSALRQRLEACPGTAERLRALREFYLERGRDREATLLTLEFKLFALRHPKMRARLAASHRRIRASLKYENLKLLPAQHSDERNELDRVLLEVVLSGLVLEHAYDPKRLSTKQTAETLGRIFDLLVSAAAS